jgi:hypothetical protein
MSEEESELHFRVRQLEQKVSNVEAGTCPLRTQIKVLIVALAILSCVVLYYRAELQNTSSHLKALEAKVGGQRAFEIAHPTSGKHDLQFHDHPEFTFSYPTVGVPVPGNKFNFTKVPKEKLAEYDRTINEFFKPYNVPQIIGRTLTACSSGSATTKTAATSSAITSSTSRRPC